MIIYKHSGTFGDLIYSLSILRKMQPGKFLVALRNIENCVSQYGYRPDEVDVAHRGRFTEQDFKLLKPLLERQSYISDVGTWQQGDAEPDVDLDRFRGTLFRGFEGNYVQAYHLAFKLPFIEQDLLVPWLDVDPVQVAPIVISRTFRYRCPKGDASWREMTKIPDLESMSVFIGNYEEHDDFIKTTGKEVPFYPVKNFLELANLVAGAELVMANQNFVFSLAMATNRSAILETIKIKPLAYNECYFPRSGITYL